MSTEKALQATRRAEWRQANPRDQLIAVIGAARGLADNIAEKLYPTPDKLEEATGRLDDLLEQALVLASMVEGSWPSAE